MNLGALLASPQNSFNTMRLVAAIAVVVSHSSLLVWGFYPLSWGPYDLGALAVNVFFFISGLMLSRSFELNPDWRRFAVARMLRIFPGLLVAGVLVGWVLTPFYTARPFADYLLDPRTLFYPLTSTLELDAIQPRGVFPDSTQPGEIGLPLWTIKYELLAYLVFGAASAAGIFRSKRTALLLCALFGLALTVTDATGLLNGSPLGSVIRFGFAFLLGVSAYRYRAAIVIRPWLGLALAAAALVLTATFAGPIAWTLAACCAAVLLAGVELPRITVFTRRTDLSFGIYIYAWPVQQALMSVEWMRGNFVLHALVALAISAVLAWLSWTLIEKPALSLKQGVRAAPRPVLAAEREPAS